jgi:hypothetical protein
VVRQGLLVTNFTDNLLKWRVSMFLRLNPYGVDRSAVEQLADPHGDVERGRETVDALIADGLVEQLGERLRAVVTQATESQDPSRAS